MSTSPISTLQSLAETWIDAWFRFRPDHASEKGYARYDARAPSFDAASVEQLRAAVARTGERLPERLSPGTSPDDLIDFALLRANLRNATFELDVLRVLERNPITYVGAGLDGIETLEMRAEAGEPGLERALLERLRALPTLMAQCRAQCTEPVDVFLEIASDMLEGGIEHLGERFSQVMAARPVYEASEEARRALDRLREHFARIAGHETRTFEPMGAAAFTQLLRDRHMLDAPLAVWTSRAEATIAEVEARLPAVFERMAEQPLGEVPEGFDRQTVLDYYRHELEAVREWVEQSGVVSVPQGPIELRETPPWLAALVPGAFYLPPPAFGASRTGYFFVHRVPEAFDEDDLEWYHEQVARRRFRNLVVHEVWPGHHLQLLRAGDHPRAMRKYRDDDVMIEGWALYCEGLAEELGLWHEQPSARPLQSLRFRALRVIVDVAIHTGQMTLEQATRYMARRLGAGGASWLEREVRRYANEPGQAMSYLVGHELVRELRENYRNHVGETRFSLRDFHDRLLDEGSIPLPLIAWKMLGAHGPLPGA